MDAHRVGRSSHDCSGGKQEPLGPWRTREPPKVDARNQHDEEQYRKDMRQSECGMRAKPRIKTGKFRWSGLWRVGQGNDAPGDHGDRNYDAAQNPMPTQPRRSALPAKSCFFSQPAYPYSRKSLCSVPDPFQKRPVSPETDPLLEAPWPGRWAVPLASPSASKDKNAGTSCINSSLLVLPFGEVVSGR